ncbi:lipopolysaccharide core biosynthesis protein LpsA [Helicobacter didelphidarum]|uniref:Lipopolysaccharide core biosynthesis protein LpsA n=1 Tax=Helicobacter didelphidarum TaxID=2040648 RepID=A0A3D8IBR6_9HELI|nr:glycosyl transferase family 90 [Helicobacter didelphidarum]RDU62597.1 lipopolysaccharide core biosynthesis protein LpsA [Helicobacter didelphidarum]
MQRYKKEPRYLYNLKCIFRAIIPRFIPQSQLEAKIAQIFRIYENKLDVLATRLNFYNKLTINFTIPSTRDELPIESTLHTTLPPPPSRLFAMKLLRPDVSILKENTLKHGSVYYYDSYEWTRYFDDNLLWTHLFHDVNQLMNFPAIVKSRPILKQNYNSILLQLEKFRHFRFIEDPIKFEEKKDILLFRGAVYQEHRYRFFQQYFGNKRCDIGHVGRGNEKWIKDKMDIQTQLGYKFLLSLEGYDVASNLKWILSSNSLCVMPKPEIETWFMESTLKDGVHYAEIKQDYSNVMEVLDYFLANPNRAKEIIANANKYCKQFYDKRLEGMLNLLVLRKYFYLSNQIEVTKQERELFELYKD